MERLSLADRMGNAVVSYAAYVGQFFCPVGLAAFYPHPGSSLPAWQIAGALSLLVCVCLGCLALRKTWPCLLIGWLWYLGMLVPVIGLVQVGQQAMADRYTYLPQIGLAMALAWAAKRMFENWPNRAWLYGVASALVLAALMGCAWRQTTYWADSETLWNRALACTSQNGLAHVNLGVALRDQGRPTEAIEQYQKALAVRPKDATAENHWGVALCDLGRAREAIGHFEKALAIDPDYAAAHNNLGGALADADQLDEAIRHYRRAIELNPSQANAHYNLGNALAKQGRFKEALAEFQRSIDVNPNSAEAHSNLGLFLAGAGRFDEAIVHLRKAVALRPGLVNAHRTLAVVLSRQGRTPEAIAEWGEVVGLQPDDPPALSQLAWILATNPETTVRNGPQAVELAQRAAKLTEGRQPAVLDTLAAALAEAGRFPEAVQTAEQALALAANQHNATLADALQTRIKLYRAAIPDRETPLRSVARTNRR